MRRRPQFAIAVIVLSFVEVASAQAQTSGRSLFSPSPDAPSQGFNWTGYYAGFHLGYARNGAKDSPQIDGGHLGGLQAGYNLQIPGSSSAAVFGVEFEASYLWEQPSRPSRTNKTIDPLWLGAAKLRYGMPIGRFLPFATGGIAMIYRENTNGRLGGSEWQAGYLVGGGIEFAVTSSVSITAEYNYFRMGKSPPGDSLEFLHTRSLSSQIAKAGLNIRF